MSDNKKIMAVVNIVCVFFIAASICLTIFSYVDSFGTVWKVVTTVETFVSVFAEAYITLLWKIKWLNFFRIPNINGKYNITLKSTYNGGIEKKGILTIRQRFLDMGVSMVFADQESHSESRGGARFLNFDGKIQLGYLYYSDTDPTHRDTNPEKKGSAIFQIEDGKLSNGEYWTDSNTRGALIIGE